MDGILTAEEFMEEELASLKNEHEVWICFFSLPAKTWVFYTNSSFFCSLFMFYQFF